MLKRCAVMGAVALFSLSRVAHPQCQYEITAVIQGPSCGIFGPTLVELLSINDLGQACGWFLDCATDDRRPFAWSEETGFVVLALPPGATRGEAKDINNVRGSDGLGQIACTLGGAALGGDRAFLYDDGEWTELPPQNGGNGSSATAINDQGELAGVRSSPILAFRWEGGLFADILSTIGGISVASHVNDAGLVVGYMGSSALEHAFIWDGQSLKDYGTVFGEERARANAINFAAAFVGGTQVRQRGEESVSRAFFIEDGVVLDLGIPKSFDHSVGKDINDARQVLVLATRVEPNVLNRAYLWQHDEMVAIVDLVVPLDGVSYGGSKAPAINNAGQIGAVAAVGTTNAGIILTPSGQPLGDVNFDCAVDEHDLTAVLRDWGPCLKVGSCICDFVTNSTFEPPGDGVVDGADLAVVLANWTGLKNASAAIRRR